MRSVLAALGYPPEFFDVALIQLVKVVRGGEEVKMSKRSGEFVTLRDLVDEVGVDAARFFFLMRPGTSELVFDVELAKRQTDENPIFYVQMAHARLSGIFRTAAVEPDAVDGPLDLAALPAPEDTELL
jgi:arginyl-tRNA synthetase